MSRSSLYSLGSNLAANAAKHAWMAMDNHGNFNRLLTRDFTLVWARMAGRSDPQKEVEISLITQRSQVQILSPLLQVPFQTLFRCNDERELTILGSEHQ